MTAAERRVVERLLDAAVGRGGEAGLPAVAETDAIVAFDAWLSAVPRRNRAALRALLRAVGARLRRLPAAERAAWLESGPGALGGAARLLVRMAVHCYYGDPEVMRRLGYDAAAVARRGLAVRAAEGRL